MSDEFNYPIKYAVLELKERGGWSERYEDIIKGYIVSKGYVVESNIKYHSSGEYEMSHKVVFPFTDIHNFIYRCTNKLDLIVGDRSVPRYDACYRPYPVEIVTDLFDTYEEACILADRRNEELIRKLLLCKYSVTEPNWKEKYNKAKIEIEKEIEICKMFEQVIINETEDMLITDYPVVIPENNQLRLSLKNIK